MDHHTHAKSSLDLQAARLAKGYSLEDLAIATGLTVEEITVAEQGAAPAQHLERIEHALT
ncbi:helix-turn-helix transcriptional regulator [Rhizobium sp. XQZ8]|uniref:helix-turn-helix domain-containing protein n=1 Tax=Rhizobium populisoli TaxID=2859785 RepID=UPI001CA52EF2|nr:helix-turn-helix transcriptional regulator [Rhizobium populisoli]MBW6425390.1 helix-turn-helix transcriptional regulator [Rhizobium populisoli]